MRLSDKQFDILQASHKICLLLSAFYSAIAPKLGLPFAEEVETVAKALAVLLVGLIEIAKSTYRQDRLNALNISEEIDSDMERDDELNVDTVSHEDGVGLG